MPQFNPEYFASQFLWLAVAFAFLYFLLNRLILPRIGSILEERAERVADDLEKAEALRAETAEVIAAYEEAVAKARANAAAEVSRAGDEVARMAAERQSRFAAELSAKVQDAEKRIDAARAAAGAEVRSIAVEAAQAVVSRLVGQAPSADRIGAAVDGVLKR